MNEPKRRFQHTAESLITFPAYPHTGRELFYDLKSQVERELGVKMTIRRLARIMGVPFASAFHWLESYPLRQVVGFMLLLERLSSEQRQDFIEQHCREFPHLAHPRLVLSADTLARLFSIMDERAGLTFIHAVEC